MNEASYSSMSHHSHSTIVERAATLASWALGGAIFLTVGWLAVEPDDPLGAVSILTRTGAPMMLLQTAALACVASALGTVLAGRRRVDIGTFAAALGLAAVSLRGSTARYLLADSAAAGSSVGRDLPIKFAFESLAWFVVVALSLVISALVTRWFSAQRDQEAVHNRGVNTWEPPLPAGLDIPGLGTRLFGAQPQQQTHLRDGVRHTAVATVLGLLAIGFFSGGPLSRGIQHGQVCFVVAAGVSVACYAAHRLMPVRSALWSIVAVLLIALIGYAWASVRPAVAGLPPAIPSSSFLRVLPIQYISVGTAAALAMFWHMSYPGEDDAVQERPHVTSPMRHGRRA